MAEAQLNVPVIKVNRLRTVALALIVLSCSGGDHGVVEPPPRVATSLTASTSTSISAAVGAAVSPEPSVVVKDQNGQPMAGVSVTFAITAGGGAITGGSATTNSSGVATIGSWTLGPNPGTNTLTASSGSLTPVTFTATGITAGSPASLTKTAGDAQTATVSTAVATLPAVVVKDASGNPLSGVTVTFAVASGGGSITGATQTTNPSGIATVGSWTLGSSPGSNTLTASSGSLTPVTFTATGVAAPASPPTSMVKSAGDGQSATVSTAVAVAPAVLVTDAGGLPVSGVIVTFAVASGGGSVTGASQATNASGIATVGSWTLGSTAGSNTLTASSGSLTPVTFTATGVAGAPGPPASLTKTAGDGQTATVSTAVAVAPAVTVKDASGNPLSGVTVTFAIASGGGSVTGATQTTNASGVATVGSWTLGSAAGSNTLTASSGSLTPVTFTATGVAAPASPPTSMVKSAGDGQSAAVGTAVAVAPAVTVTDASGSPVSGVIVTFAVASGGGSVTGASQATNASGIATVGSWTLGSAAGSNTLTASSGSLAPVTFTATGVAGSPGLIVKTAGDNQAATVSTAVAIAPAATVTDASGNPLSGVTVTFAVASGGGSVTGATQITDAAGIATVGSWTLGPSLGANTLTASSGSLTPVTFTATGVAPPASPPTSMVKSAGDGQSATVGTAVATAPAVTVTDASGLPVSGVIVTFTVAGGGGSVSSASQATNASGVATVGSWTLGPLVGSNTLTASSGSLTPVTFTATGVAGPPALLVKTAGDGQAAIVSTAVAIAPAVAVKDARGNPLSGVTVTFAVASGGGSIAGATQLTNASGIATVGSWTLGPSLGANALAASSGSLTPVTFTATGVAPPPAPPTSMVKSAGDGQSATVGTAVAIAPAVTVTDASGSPVSGVIVVFAIASGGGSVTGANQITNASGVATVGSWTLGPLVGTKTLTASSGSLTPVTFTATGVAGPPALLVKTAGDGQSATYGTTVAVPPSVKVTDASGNPLSGLNVSFAVASGGGSITGGAQVTNASGIATVGSWTVGSNLGTNTLTASSGSLTPVTFTATSKAGPPTSMVISAGDGQSTIVTTAVSVSPAVTLIDAAGHPVSAATVVFAVASGGGSVTGATQTTNASGVATVGSWSLGSAPGSNTLTASSGSLTPVTFTATALVGPPALMVKTAGDGQSGTVSLAVAIPPAVTVTDIGGNPLSGVSVVFAVTSGGGSVTGANQTTDVSGVATVGSWTLGPNVGSNKLTASSGSLPPVTFNATGHAPPTVTPTSMVASAGDGQSATASAPVSIPPAVLVTDASSNPVGGVPVSFSIGSGGGSVSGASVLTDASGIAAIGAWILGPDLGTNTLTAKSPSLPTVTFTATGTALAGNPCTTSIPHLLGTTTNAILTTSDCLLSGGQYADFYSTTTPSADAYLFTQTSRDIDTKLTLFAADGTLIADNDDESFVSHNSAIKAILPSGNYLLGASAYAPGEVGYYALSSEITPADVNNCEDVFIVRGVSTTQNIDTTDCEADTFTDLYLIYLTAGQSITISMSSSAVDAYLELYKPGTLVASNDNASGTNAQIVYTPTTTGYYIIYARTAAAGQTGSYTLNIQ